MASDKQVQEGIGSGYTTKQKGMAALVVIILGIVIWQIMGLLGGSSGGEETVTPQAPVAKMAPGAKPATQQMPMTGTASGAPNTMPGANNFNAPAGNNAAPAVLPQPAQPREPAALTNADLIRNQQEQQKQFLTSVNELQMLKLQKDIAETNQAIEAAKLATETTKKSINDLLAKPAPAPVIPAGNYASSLVNPGQVTPTPPGVVPVVDGSTPTTAAPLGNPADAPTPYVVISVSMQMNRWTAVLGNQGKLYSVSIGDVLPTDGWIVANISKDGVVLKKNNQSRKISLVPVI